jgi:hypothetical protein
MRELLATIVELHDCLSSAEIPHAFGGALALMWCTGEPRTTIDIDLNVFTPIADLDLVLSALPAGITVSEHDHAILVKEGQHRLFYEDIPVDVFFNTTNFHKDLVIRTTNHTIAERQLPFLCCDDLAVFKCFYNRRKDWADIEAMMRAKQIDVSYVLGMLVEHLGLEDERVKELLKIRNEVSDT